jgi:RHS repeat-associated protein
MFGFASEQLDASGLLYLRARFYSPAVSAFLSRDIWGGYMYTPSSFNKWTYAYQNPISMVDPMGDRPICPPNEGICLENYDFGLDFASDYAITWYWKDRASVYDGVKTVASSMARVLRSLGQHYQVDDVFRRVFGTVRFYMSATETWVDANNDGIMGRGEFYYCGRDPGKGVKCFKESRGDISPRLIAHELGHVFNATVVNRRSAGLIPSSLSSPYNELEFDKIFAFVEDSSSPSGISSRQIAGNTAEGYLRTRYGYRSEPGFQQNTSPVPGEDFADMFMNWSFGRSSFSSDHAGLVRYSWMERNMRVWLSTMLGLKIDLNPQRAFCGRILRK